MPPPPVMPHGGGAEAPTIFQKRTVKMGALMGSVVGLCIGFLFGTTAILKNGAGPRGFLPSLSGYMLSSAATFGFFMSIGTVIRTDGLTMKEWAEREVREGRLGRSALMVQAGTSASTDWAKMEWERRRKTQL